MPAITKPNLHFDATTYTGTGSALSVTNGGFQPDFVWIKRRDGTQSHQLYDVIRGVNKTVYSNLTDGETTEANGLSAFTSSGFTVISDIGVNTSGGTYVGWNWKAGGTAVSNTSGTISSQVSANPTAGFSVVTYTANNTAGETIGHGLGVAPSFIIVKSRSAVNSWNSYHISLGNTKGIDLNSTNAASTSSNYWNNTSPTSSVFSVAAYTNNLTGTYVAYCFSAVAGYSAFGSYTGNGTQGAGPFVYTGFRPKYVLIKNVDGAYDWHCFDTARGQYNYSGSNILKPNASDAELTARNDVQIDFLSNGFRLIGNDIGINQSTSTHIYAAFASAPFKYANAF